MRFRERVLARVRRTKVGQRLLEDKRYQSIAKAVVGGYKKIEDTVTGGYKKVEDTVVEGYTKIEDAFVERYLTKEGETVTEAKERLKKEGQK